MAIQRTAHVDNVLFEELQCLWETEEFPISAVIELLRQEFDIKQQTLWEQLLLYGRIRDNWMTEQIAGWLIAIIPGIVILDTHPNHHLTLVSGLVERPAPSDGALFTLRTFSSGSSFATLKIFPSGPPERQGKYQTCPAWISFQLPILTKKSGADTEEVFTLGIDRHRWKVLGPWLNKWLPKE